MRKAKKLGSILIVLLFISISSKTFAQAKKSKIDIGMMVGISKINGDFENTSAGFTGGLLARYVPLDFLSFSVLAEAGRMTSGLDAIKTTVFSTSFSGSYIFMPYNVVNPYLSFGVSLYHYGAKDAFNNRIYSPDGELYRGWETAMQIGAGVELAATRNWSLNGLLNYSFTSNDGLDGIAEGGSDGYLRAMIGMVTHLGSPNTKSNKVRRRSSHWQKQKKEVFKSVMSEDRIESSIQSFSQGIFFEKGTAVLKLQSKVQLDKIYKFLINNPEEEIELIGKSSAARRTVKYDLVIRRAEAVKSYLVMKGIEAHRIKLATQKK